jgi:hypothetical protein
MVYRRSTPASMQPPAPAKTSAQPSHGADVGEVRGYSGRTRGEDYDYQRRPALDAFLGL